MAEQLPLDLRIRPALGREDFVVAPSNADALAMVEGKGWPGGRLALTGPAASGKTHLAHVWAKMCDALVVPALDLPRYDIPTLAAARRIAVEDVPEIAGRAKAETALFHLYNRLGSLGGRLLVTGRTPPASWPIALPDLKSRLTALTTAELSPPDDALLGALLEKQLSDRGLEASLPVLRYLVTRMTRSAEAARDLADALDRVSLARHRPVTIPLAKTALATLAGPAHPTDES
ncbi:chromosomal replication initiator DnaA [Palleronia caenipelagi]|uniref:Chromosomal replication initiator DnaA n=2 Tax=Palleronia caenipelagi TaxID=2489174 RepID=A0A547PRC0_9RHOB|nr:DnaA/Hda family protein [Palleronia caenipelagi]TRD16698.1 chromosomal replication initiator DnaA [Palleronia caenipelagi]